MKKLKRGRKFNRETDQRKALIKSLARSLFIKEKITTTEAKAKEISIFADKFITTSKKASLPARRDLARFFTPEVVKKLMDDIAPRYKERNGGYTRVIKLGPRRNGRARMAIIELVK